MISAGELRHPLAFCETIKSKNEFNETIETEKQLFTKKAKIVTNAKQRERLSDGMDTTNTITFNLRYSNKINEDLVIKFNNQIFEILDIDNPGYLNRELFITATKYVQN